MDLDMSRELGGDSGNALCSLVSLSAHMPARYIAVQWSRWLAGLVLFQVLVTPSAKLSLLPDELTHPVVAVTVTANANMKYIHT